MAHSFAVVCEGPADQRTGCDLADRVFCAQVDWIEDKTLLHYRGWRGFSPGELYLTWSEAKKLAEAQNIKSHGFFDEQPAAHDAHAARKALLLLERSDERPNAIVLLRDDDGDENRLAGLKQAR